jgi:N-formylglutamate amidohydrolase
MTRTEFKTAYNDAAKTESVMIEVNNKAYFDEKTITHDAWVEANAKAARHFEARISHLENIAA